MYVNGKMRPAENIPKNKKANHRYICDVST
jgi:hypothetical protein